MNETTITIRGRLTADPELRFTPSGAGYADYSWSLWLVEDAPAPVDPDAELVERMAEAMWRIEEKPPTDYAGAVDDPEGWQELAHAALKALRETHDVTARAEQ